MQINRAGKDTDVGPGEWFTGAVYVDMVAVPTGTSRVSAHSDHFAPAAAQAEVGK